MSTVFYDINWSTLNAMTKQECIPVGLRTARSSRRPRGVYHQATPLGADPPQDQALSQDQIPPGPGTPPWTRHPRGPDTPLIPGTPFPQQQTPWTRHPPLVNRMTGQTGVKT